MTATIEEPEASTALATIDPQALISQAIQKGANIDVLERLVALATSVRAMQAREAFYDAISEFQKQCPPVKKNRTADVGRYTYSYADLDQIKSSIMPTLAACRLSIRFRIRTEAKKVTAVCIVSHAFGHSEESGEVEMPIQDYDGKGANPAQLTAISQTYAKRYALCAALAITAEDDPDARAGETRKPHTPADDSISEQQRKGLFAHAREHGWSNEQLHLLMMTRGYEHTGDIKVRDLGDIRKAIANGPPAEPIHEGKIAPDQTKAVAETADRTGWKPLEWKAALDKRFGVMQTSDIPAAKFEEAMKLAAGDLK